MLYLLYLAIAAAPIAPTPPREASVTAAVAVVRAYYRAVDRHDYRVAYAIWHGGRSLAAFRRGYAQTRRVAVTPLPPFTTEGGAGSIYAEIKVRVDAELRSGAHQHFAGTYLLRRVNDVDGATPAQRRWHIVGARLRELPAGR